MESSRNTMNGQRKKESRTGCKKKRSGRKILQKVCSFRITASPSRTERSCIRFMSKLEESFTITVMVWIISLSGKSICHWSQYPKRKEIGFMWSLHRNYLKDYKSGLYSYLTFGGKLWTYLADLNEQCLERRDFLMEQIMEQEGITEELKSRDQMEWVHRNGNNARSRVIEYFKWTGVCVGGTYEILDWICRRKML